MPGQAWRTGGDAAITRRHHIIRLLPSLCVCVSASASPTSSHDLMSSNSTKAKHKLSPDFCVQQSQSKVHWASTSAAFARAHAGAAPACSSLQRERAHGRGLLRGARKLCGAPCRGECCSCGSAAWPGSVRRAPVAASSETSSNTATRGPSVAGARDGGRALRANAACGGSRAAHGAEAAEDHLKVLVLGDGV